MNGLSGALLRFRIMAWITGVLLAIMSVVFLPLKYGFNLTDEGILATLYAIGWQAHGWLYLLYVAAGLDICFRMRYSVLRTVGVLLAGTIPFASFFADHYVTRSVHQRMSSEYTTP
jgi:integral membrane protein